jgi:hypothetical protein
MPIERHRIEALIAAMIAIGYKFDAVAKPAEIGWALELRLARAIAYAKSKNKRKDPFASPALRWVEEENIVLPSRFFPHPRAPGVLRTDRAAKQKIRAFEKESKLKLHSSVSQWFVQCGSVDFSGTHPFLNPGGKHSALRIGSFEDCAVARDGAWLPLAPGAWRVNLSDGRLEDGRAFDAALNGALDWAGLPALEFEPDKPQTELDFLRQEAL